jgi:lipopolysaccharide transport system ATP-binding protein
MHASNAAIKVQDLSKQYMIGRDHARVETFQEVLVRAFTAPFRRSAVGNAAKAQKKQFWALKDVSFEVARGEVVGVIGRNGAGKSTLLKILSRITEPTQGRIEIRGRVASLLEVGTGFHPELTGRENIYLNGAILGMSRAEISRKFDDIVGFAEVEKFIDTPVKHYSSGMYVRLAFAVAAHLDQDILFVDEVLAVGDTEFQKRCVNKMKDMSICGRTVVFVSHNLTAIRNLCSRGLLLASGTIVKSGPIGDVLSSYAGGDSTKLRGARNYSNTDDGRLVQVSVVSVAGALGEPLRATAEFSIRIEVEVDRPGEFGVFLYCYNENQQLVFSTDSFFDKSLSRLRLDCGMHLLECIVPGHLTDGTYVLDLLLIRNHQVVVSEAAVLSFRVVDDFATIDGWNWRPANTIRPKTTWRHEQLSERADELC